MEISSIQCELKYFVCKMGLCLPQYAPFNTIHSFCPREKVFLFFCIACIDYLILYVCVCDVQKTKVNNCV